MTLICRVNRSRTIHVSLSAPMDIALRDRYDVDQSIVCGNASVVAEPAPHPAQPDLSRISAGERDTSFVTIGHLSNLSVEKGLEDVYRTYELLKADGVDVRMVVAGEAATQRDLDVVEDAKCAHPEIVHLGRLRRDQLGLFFASIDVFLFPSRYSNEAEPLVVLEALANGVPVMATAIGYVPAISFPADWCFPLEADFARRAVQALTRVDAAGLSGLRDQARRTFDLLNSTSNSGYLELIDILSTVGVRTDTPSSDV